MFPFNSGLSVFTYLYLFVFLAVIVGLTISVVITKTRPLHRSLTKGATPIYKWWVAFVLVILIVVILTTVVWSTVVVLNKTHQPSIITRAMGATRKFAAPINRRVSPLMGAVRRKIVGTTITEDISDFISTVMDVWGTVFAIPTYILTKVMRIGAFLASFISLLMVLLLAGVMAVASISREIHESMVTAAADFFRSSDWVASIKGWARDFVDEGRRLDDDALVGRLNQPIDEPVDADQDANHGDE